MVDAVDGANGKWSAAWRSVITGVSRLGRAKVFMVAYDQSGPRGFCSFADCASLDAALVRINDESGESTNRSFNQKLKGTGNSVNRPE